MRSALGEWLAYSMEAQFFAELSASAIAVIAFEVGQGLICDDKSLVGFNPATGADRAAGRALGTLIDTRFSDQGI